MNNRIKKKLRSRTGASISYALLLFLVCAVLCSVLLTAATASSGRMSQIAETDQRYYAVTSSAELLKDMIDGKPVSVVKVEQTEYKTTYTDGNAGSPVQDGETIVKTYIISDKKAGDIVDGDLIDANLIDSAKIDSIQKDAAKNLYKSQSLSNRELNLTSDFYSATGLDYDSLAVTAMENMGVDGNITLTVYNTFKGKNAKSVLGERYALVLEYGVDRNVITDTKTENVSSTAVSENEYTVKTKTTNKTITTFIWNLTDMKTNP